jgi:hypothetical protein
VLPSILVYSTQKLHIIPEEGNPKKTEKRDGGNIDRPTSCDTKVNRDLIRCAATLFRVRRPYCNRGQIVPWIIMCSISLTEPTTARAVSAATTSTPTGTRTPAA